MTTNARSAAWLALLLIACSGAGAPTTEEQPTEGQPRAPTTEATAPTTPTTPDDTTDEPSCDDGPSPWGNSLPDDDINEVACGQTAHAPGPPCETNSDCGICHDGSDCGRPANREEIERLGGQCCQQDAAQCEYAVVRCCAGHCRITGD